MVLTKCLKCGKDLPAGAKSCPDCDGPAPEELMVKGVGAEKWSYRKMAGKVVFIVLIVIGVLLLFALAGALVLFLTIA